MPPLASRGMSRGMERKGFSKVACALCCWCCWGLRGHGGGLAVNGRAQGVCTAWACVLAPATVDLVYWCGAACRCAGVWGCRVAGFEVLREGHNGQPPSARRTQCHPLPHISSLEPRACLPFRFFLESRPQLLSFKVRHGRFACARGALYHIGLVYDYTPTWLCNTSTLSHGMGELYQPNE